MASDAENMTIIVTMAGFGSRFTDVGYSVPKYEIVVRGKTLFAWSQRSLTRFINSGASFVFVCRQGLGAERFIPKEADALSIRQFEIIQLDEPTDGQATSALLAKPAIRYPAGPVLIYNIDTYVEPNYLDPSEMWGDGWIPCFAGEGDSWSFVRVGDDGDAIEVREKERISPHASIGLYGFASLESYASVYEAHFANTAGLRAERYIAPMYNRLIGDGKRVHISTIPRQAVHPLGTPAEVERFARSATV